MTFIVGLWLVRWIQSQALIGYNVTNPFFLASKGVASVHMEVEE